MTLRKLIKYRTLAHLKKNKALREAVPYSQAKKIGIIYSSDTYDKFKGIKSFVVELENEGKKVEVLNYLGKNRDNHEFLFNYFKTNDFTFWGGYKAKHLESFTEKTFDYLIHLDTNSNIYIENILAASNAKCRIGPHISNKREFYELMFSVHKNEGTTELIRQIKHYTKKIADEIPA